MVVFQVHILQLTREAKKKINIVIITKELRLKWKEEDMKYEWRGLNPKSS